MTLRCCGNCSFYLHDAAGIYLTFVFWWNNQFLLLSVISMLLLPVLLPAVTINDVTTNVLNMTLLLSTVSLCATTNVATN